MDHQISDNISITINLTKIPQKVDFFKANPQKHELWLFSRLELQSSGFGIDYIPRIFTKKIRYLKFFWSYWYIKWWMMAMDSKLLSEGIHSLLGRFTDLMFWREVNQNNVTRCGLFNLSNGIFLGILWKIWLNYFLNLKIDVV